MSETASCRICGHPIEEFLDLGRQPLSDAFPLPGETSGEFFYSLRVAFCAGCTMVQLMEEIPREKMFNQDYPYHSSGSRTMREHFEETARSFLERVSGKTDPFVVEIGCNDGVMLGTVADAGVRHLGFEPSGGVAALAGERGVRVTTQFFEKDTATAVREADGGADVIFSANTICHIPYLDSLLEGVATLLAPGGVFLFEDPYLGDIVAKTSFDQIYDEHYYLFSARSVREAVRRFGLDLVDVERKPVHGGEIRYTIGRAGEHEPTAAVAELLAAEEAQGLADIETLRGFADGVRRIREDLRALLADLQAAGSTVAAYGATAKSATVTNFCDLGPELVGAVYDNTPAKQNRLTPGVHLPVRPSEGFAADPPDYALLFAWNHAEEIMANEQAFSDAGGKWIMYVPTVHVV